MTDFSFAEGREAEMNGIIEASISKLIADLKAASPKKSGKLRRRIKARYKYDSGVIERVIINVDRYGLILDAGSPSVTRYKGWFTDIFNQYAEELAGELAEFAADGLVDNLKFRNQTFKI